MVGRMVSQLDGCLVSWLGGQLTVGMGGGYLVEWAAVTGSGGSLNG